MSKTPLQNDSGLDDIIAGFLEAEEVGRPVSPEQVIAAHPEFAEELRNFFADRDLLRSAARPLADAVVARRPVVGKIRYFGDYELLEEIARGGMGVVYKARQTSLNRVVAVKMILAGHLASEVDVQRFQTEAEAAARLQHPNIVSVHEVGRHDGQCYFSMDYVEGQNLAEMTGDHPLPVRDAVRYVEEIARAIHHAHQLGTLHRDLKPSNVLIDADNRARITDFGLAVHIDGDSRLTQSGQAVGTPPYMPPEQAQGKRGLIGPASDIYSLGAVLYELLTGRPPFRGATSVETVRQVIDDHPVSPRLLNSSIPADIETICLKCLEKEPHRRYATAEQLADDLQRYLEGKPILARPVGRVARFWSWCRRRPLLALLSGALMLATVALIVVLAIANFMVTDALDQRTEALTEARLQQQATEAALKAEQTALAAKQAALSARDTALKREQWQNYARGIQLVQRECEAGNLDEARKLLAECGPPALRGFEWHYLHALCRSPLWHEWKGRIVRAATPFTATGQIVSQIDGECHLYDIAGGRVVERFPLPKFRNIEAVSPDGRRLALLSRGAVHRDIVILELPGGRHLRTISVERTEYVRNVFFSRDGKQVAAVVEPRMDQILNPAGRNGSGERRPSVFQVWDLTSGQSIRSVKPQGLMTPANAYKTVVAGISGTLQLLATPEGVVDTVTGQSVIVSAEPVVAAAFNRDASLAALSTTSGLVSIWDLRSRVRIATWPVAGSVRSLAFQPGGDMLTAGCTNGSVYFRDVRSGQERAPLKTGASIRDLAFAPETGLLVSGHVPRRGQTAFRIWKTARRGELALQGTPTRLVNWGQTAAISRDGRLVALLGDNHSVVLHDAATGDIVRRIDGAKRKTSVAFNHDGTLVATSGDEGFLIWEVATGRQQTQIPPPQGATYCTQVAFSPDGRYLAGAHERGATVWEWKTATRVKSFRCRGRCYSSVMFSSDGRFLCATAERGSGRIWNVADWSERCRPVDASAYSGDLSPDDRLLATADQRRIALVDTRSGELKRTIPLTQLSRVVAFTPDGKRIATSAGRRILILDRKTGQPLLTLTGHQGGVTSLTFSRDGRRLVSASSDGTVRIWGGATPGGQLSGDVPPRS